VSGTLVSAATAPPPAAAAVETAPAPIQATPNLAAAPLELVEPPALAPTPVSAAVAVRPPLATHGEIRTRRDPPIFKECPEAVAALGLCNPSTKQEK
jgi:hypothetical protein